MLLPTASADDIAFIQNHTTAAVLASRPRLTQTKQVHAAAGPVNTVAPAVTGTPTVGQTLTCAPGTWLNSPTFTYQWRWRGVGIIPGATATTRVLAAVDHGQLVECEVIGTVGASVVSAMSNALAVP
jgi:hypothetical protein